MEDPEWDKDEGRKSSYDAGVVIQVKKIVTCTRVIWGWGDENKVDKFEKIFEENEQGYGNYLKKL